MYYLIVCLDQVSFYVSISPFPLMIEAQRGVHRMSKRSRSLGGSDSVKVFNTGDASFLPNETE